MIKNNDKKRNDLFLGAVLFLAAAVLFLGQHVFREKGAAIQVLVKDEEFGTYPLSAGGLLDFPGRCAGGAL